MFELQPHIDLGRLTVPPQDAAGADGKIDFFRSEDDARVTTVVRNIGTETVWVKSDTSADERAVETGWTRVYVSKDDAKAVVLLNKSSHPAICEVQVVVEQ